MNKQQIIAGTLKWCNERRKEKGMEKLNDLPKGFRKDGESCPCGKATGMFVGKKHYFRSAGDFFPTGRVPEAVALFVPAFDDGQFPEYEHE